MTFKNFFCSTLFIFSFATHAGAQMPACSNGLVYYIENGSIYNYDPSQPLSASNPVLNTISAPSGASALAVSSNLNAAGPSPTFYVVDGGTYKYYDGSTWVNTGHTAGGTNIGAGGGFIYAFTGSQVWKYNGTGNATSILTVSGWTAYAADVVADCSGNFFLLNLSPANLYEYSSAGTQINSWTVTGLTSPTFLGLGKISDTIYGGYTSMYKGVISGSSVSFTNQGTLTPNANDMATCGCPTCPGSVVASATTDTVCAGDTVHLFSAGTTSSSVTYSWTGPNGFSSTLQNPVVNGVSTLGGGTYTVTAQDTGSCAYVSSVNIVVKSVPAVTASSNSPLCPGVTLNLNATTVSGATYQWSGPNSFSSFNQNPSLTSFVSADTGNYQVTTTLNGCSVMTSTHVTLNNPGTPSITYNPPLCPGDTLKLFATSTTPGVTFSWTGPASFSSSLQNPIIPNVQSSNGGTYFVTVHLTGCSSVTSAPIYINPTVGAPVITISVSPNDSICNGDNVTFSATATNTGNAPVYQWRKNGNDISGATSITYNTSTVADGDIFTCRIIANAACQSIDSGVSTGIHMHIKVLSPPVVSVTSYPSPYAPGDTVTFTGHVPAVSTAFTYQWVKNGVKIPGATTIVYTTRSVVLGDSICLIVHTPVPCTYPDSTVACVQLTNGINNINSGISGLNIYPNPSKGSFNISGKIVNSNNVTIEIINTLGRLVYTEQVQIENNRLQKQVNLNKAAAGVYTLLIKTENETKVSKLVVNP